jgi:FkbM family methyltransferase
MPRITEGRKREFCRELLAEAGAVVGLVDVGSGGALKRPWRLLPGDKMRKFDFEPTQESQDQLPVCVSNRTGRSQFHVAHDERGSSFHLASRAFAERFGMQSLYPKRTIEVECTTLDHHFEGRYALIDALDVNVEGHDHQVLEGATRLLATGSVKLLKFEFEVAEVWQGQGWLSDIDPLLRSGGYVPAGLEVEMARPVAARHCFHRGEPVWGKALYVPGPALWATTLRSLRSRGEAIDESVAKAVALYVVADVPGHAFDLLDLGTSIGGFTRLDAARVRARIASAYRWAKIEFGVSEFARLVRQTTGFRGLSTEA